MKKQVILLLLLASVALLMCSCITKKRCNDKFPPVVSSSDSNNSKEVIIYKDTVVHDTIPGDTLFVEVLVECDKNGKLINKPKSLVHSDIFIDVFFSIKNNKPLIEVIRKPIYRDYLFQKIYAEKLREHFSKSNTVTTVTETNIPWWVWLVCAASIITSLSLAIKR